jgi:hypothetical protein
LARSAIGTAHVAHGISCQDAYRTCALDEQGAWIGVAVADGAGSASHSDVGAAIACEAILNSIRKRWPDVPSTRAQMVEVYYEARVAVFAEAARLAVPPRQLACTLLLAVSGPSSSAFAQLGDGATIVKSGDELWSPVRSPPSEYVNETEFITGERYADVLDFAWLDEPIEGFALMTDGLQNLAVDYPAYRPHAAFFRPFFETVRATEIPDELIPFLDEFLSSPRVNERTDDDKTLAIAIRRP